METNGASPQRYAFVNQIISGSAVETVYRFAQRTAETFSETESVGVSFGRSPKEGEGIDANHNDRPRRQRDRVGKHAVGRDDARARVLEDISKPSSPARVHADPPMQALDHKAFERLQGGWGRWCGRPA